MLNFSDLLLGFEDTQGGVNIMKYCISTTVLKTMCCCMFMAVSRCWQWHVFYKMKETLVSFHAAVF